MPHTEDQLKQAIAACGFDPDGFDPDKSTDLRLLATHVREQAEAMELMGRGVPPAYLSLLLLLHNA
jgi:hypothetical protein